MFDNFSLKTIIGAIVAVVILFAATWGTIHQDAQQILITQSAGGTLTVVPLPGWHFVPISKVTSYPRRDAYEFKSPIRFNDGGKAIVIGSIQYEIPTDDKTLIDLHSKYGSAATLKAQLVEKVVDKAIFMSGPLMSSRESYAEKKAELVNDVEDQITHGIFQTRQKEIEVSDPITGVKKTVMAVETVLDRQGVPQRQEGAILTPFGVKTFNFTISEVDYDKNIEAQIQAQQQITMDVQTAVANAKKAEQNVLTVTKQGEANAAAAKWEQEVLKAKAVTAAQQELEVAKLQTLQAEQQKQALILKAEGESEYKRKIIVADGALQQKLAAWIEVNKNYSIALGAYKGNWVPTTVMGGTSGSTGNVQDLISLATAKFAKDISLDPSITTPQK